MNKFEAAAAIARILEAFPSADDKVFVLRTAADSHGLKAKGSGGNTSVALEVAKVLAADRARDRKRVTGTSSLGTAVVVDFEEIDDAHDKALGRGRYAVEDDEDVAEAAAGNGIF